MNYYLKKFFLILVYLISSGIIASGALLIEGVEIIKLILLMLNLALFLFIYCSIAFKDGEKALRVRISNDKMRELIIQTGDDYKLDLDGEYKARKGFIVGANACIPLVVLLLISLWIGHEGNVAEKTVELFYLVFFGFFNLDFMNVHEDALFASCYWTLIAVPFLIVLHGVFFCLGARKVELQQEAFRNKTIGF